MICESRGECVGALSSSCGAERDPDGVFRVEAELAISSGAAHLGKFSRCPIAIAREYDRIIDAIVAEYRIVKRFGMRNDETIPLDLLIVLDLEIGKLEDVERKRAEQLAFARAKAKNRGS